jgi:hypothetical protein
MNEKRVPHESTRVLLEIGHTMFLLPKGTCLREAHAAAALLTRSKTVSEGYEESVMKLEIARPVRVRFSLISPDQAPDEPAQSGDAPFYVNN